MVWVSPFVIGLGIADVYLTYVLNCTSGCTLSTALALTWVSVGIWAPIPVMYRQSADSHIHSVSCFNIAVYLFVEHQYSSQEFVPR
jgi:hypothetical protein